KFLFFLLTLFLLIAAEYYFLTEIFARKRLPVIVGSITCVLFCIFIFLRFFKKSVVASFPG
ncbi:MAG TPA: hypothetical protein VM871_12570, partial [Flavisolibacter sp.]|nr:hypothetical protein [Flavisolibacter sp.]